MPEGIKVRISKDTGQPTDETFPHISKALIEKLEKIFPPRCPTLTMSDRDVWFMCGQVDAIRYLRQQYERQREERE